MLGEKSTLSAPNSSAAQQRKCERYPLLLSPPSTPARPLLGNLPRLFSHAYGNGLDEHGKHKRASKLRILTTCVLLVTLSWPSPSQEFAFSARRSSHLPRRRDSDGLCGRHGRAAFSR